MPDAYLRFLNFLLFSCTLFNWSCHQLTWYSPLTKDRKNCYPSHSSHLLKKTTKFQNSHFPNYHSVYYHDFSWDHFAEFSSFLSTFCFQTVLMITVAWCVFRTLIWKCWRFIDWFWVFVGEADFGFIAMFLCLIPRGRFLILECKSTFYHHFCLNDTFYIRIWVVLWQSVEISACFGKFLSLLNRIISLR